MLQIRQFIRFYHHSTAQIVVMGSLLLSYEANTYFKRRRLLAFQLRQASVVVDSFSTEAGIIVYR